MTFKVLLHHYGRFTSPPGREFVGEMVATIDHPIDLTTVLIPNNGSLEESFACIISEETKKELEESLSYLHQMKKRKIKKIYYYELLGELGHYKLEIYIDHLGVDFVIAKYIFPNASSAKMMTIPWPTTQVKVKMIKGSNPNNIRLTVLTKLQEALDEEAILEQQILDLMHRFADRFTDRRVEINNLMVLQDHPLIDYVLGRERLTGPNYMDWMRYLRFTLRYENKEYVLDEQIPIIDDDSTQEEIEAHQKNCDDANKLSINIILSGLPADYNQFVLLYQMNEKETSIIELHSLLQTVEQWIKKIDVPSTSVALVLTVGHNAKKRKTPHPNWKGKAAKGKSDSGSEKG
uniref:Oligopeptide transporter n=1 Tax=Tanacetum cinerariifolium TaxID=118510 RepID=A0A6L2KM45_TANCI|nr:oligopeptide transporter [Tanacetum cinerariifolium]